MSKLIPWSREERETILRFDQIDKCWYMWTNIQRHYTRAKRMGYDIKRELLLDNNSVYEAEFKIHSNAISFRDQEKILERLTR